MFNLVHKSLSYCLKKFGMLFEISLYIFDKCSMHETSVLKLVSSKLRATQYILKKLKVCSEKKTTRLYSARCRFYDANKLLVQGDSIRPPVNISSSSSFLFINKGKNSRFAINMLRLVLEFRTPPIVLEPVGSATGTTLHRERQDARILGTLDVTWSIRYSKIKLRGANYYQA